ncbi:MAG: redoxin domain-containing protein [Clostridia bacterium]|nr:redoxin domain-containing protein [Clostridia bacterium]
MKFFKKLAMLALTLVTCLSFGLAVGCKDENTGEEVPDEYLYKIRVQSEGGFGLRNVSVGLYDGETLVMEKLTSAQGDAYFTEEDDLALDEYEVRISDLPEGWHMDDTISYQTSSQAQTDLNVSLTPRLITDKTIPASKSYALGDVMYDFTVTTCAGTTFRLSDVLQEKKMLLLNFWATWCGPCKQEFPAMQNAYVSAAPDGTLISDDVAILALSTTDTQAAVTEFKADNGLSFEMAGEADVTSHFNTSAVPVSIVIDRYGVISYWHTGSMTATSDFLGLFDKFTGDNYIQTVIGEGEYGGGEAGDSGTTERVKPNASAPTTTDVDRVLHNNGAFTASWENDEYSWPFTIEKDGDGNEYLRASNADVHYSYSILNLDFTAKANDTIFFDAWVSTEAGADALYVLLDGSIVHQISGVIDKWQTYCAYVFEEGDAGKHTLSLCYIKDTSGSGGEDEVWLRNLRFGTKSDIGTGKTVKGVDILRNAAWGLNAAPENAASYTGEKKTQFKNYVNVALNETDGYYHVDENNDNTADANEPILFANLMNVTPWNEYDIWQLAYNGYLVYDGMNLSDAIEDYAWVANNALNRDGGVNYVPVSESLKHLLDTVAKVDVIVGAKADANYHLPYHANEWLETCVYYSHYGDTEPMKDPTTGISFDAAIPVYENVTNHIEVDVSIVPIGIKHKFVPTKTGVYHFYSTVPVEYENTASSYDPVCWIMDADGAELAYADDTVLVSNNENYDNFNIYLPLEAGQTYYVVCGFFLNATGEFDLEIDYLGTSYTYLTNCAIDTYSYNEVTGETYVPDAIEYAYDQANDVYYYDANGNGSYEENVDGALYLDMVHSTYLFPSTSLQLVIEEAYEKYPDASKRLFYLNGIDYTDLMKKYLFYALLGEGDEYGMVKVNQELMDVMLLLTKKADGFGGVENSWQYMCYYEKTLGA